jgi:hypothetical protein
MADFQVVEMPVLSLTAEKFSPCDRHRDGTTPARPDCPDCMTPVQVEQVVDEGLIPCSWHEGYSAVDARPCPACRRRNVLTGEEVWLTPMPARTRLLWMLRRIITPRRMV